MLIAAVLAAGVLLGAACSSGSTDKTSPPSRAGASTPGGATVVLKSLAFQPAVLRVKVGTTVTWRNEESITHTVTSGRALRVDHTSGLRSGQQADGRFNARLNGTGDTFSFTFARPGKYPYYCSIHFGMNAEVIVTK